MRSAQLVHMTTASMMAQAASAVASSSAVTLEEGRAIRQELQSIQHSLTSGEAEKVELMRSLACLKDDLIRLQHSDSTLDVSSAASSSVLGPGGQLLHHQAGGGGGGFDKFSTASQTDLSGEVRLSFVV